MVIEADGQTRSTHHASFSASAEARQLDPGAARLPAPNLSPPPQTPRILTRCPRFLLLFGLPFTGAAVSGSVWRGTWACCGATMAVDCYLRFPQ